MPGGVAIRQRHNYTEQGKVNPEGTEPNVEWLSRELNKDEEREKEQDRRAKLQHNPMPNRISIELLPRCGTIPLQVPVVKLKPSVNERLNNRCIQMYVDL